MATLIITPTLASLLLDCRAKLNEAKPIFEKKRSAWQAVEHLRKMLALREKQLEEATSELYAKEARLGWIAARRDLQNAEKAAREAEKEYSKTYNELQEARSRAMTMFEKEHLGFDEYYALISSPFTG